MPRRRAAAEPELDRRLALNQWMLGRLGVRTFEDLADVLGNPEDEGLKDSRTAYCNLLQTIFGSRMQLPSGRNLTEYDDNIVRHWRRITESRNRSGETLQLKYFQYLALLFAEIYLDYYYRVGKRALLWELNRHLARTTGHGLPPFKLAELNKAAFWMATGSGKTLLMHVNILQYLHYARDLKGQKPDRIVLLTPNEGLSHQHLEEFALSNLPARLFSAERQTALGDTAVDVLDIIKLQPDEAKRSDRGVSVPASAFEGNNLVLVDEGHKGTSSGDGDGAWLQRRNQLCAQGFSFEYSATFGQAIGASKSAGLKETYAKCILFNYSYRYFHGDGYGKDYRILNLKEDAPDDEDSPSRRQYLTACLLNFYQQLRLHKDGGESLRPWRLATPLMVFVGSSVKKKNARQRSDIRRVLLTLARFVGNAAQSQEDIGQLLSDQTELRDTDNRPLFQGAFAYLSQLDMEPQAIFHDMLDLLFHFRGSGAPTQNAAALRLDELRGTSGEIGLRLGEGGKYFGVINVGDPGELCNLCRQDEEEGLIVDAKDIAAPLFPQINNDDSTVRMLIGSRKFTEGWSSWRVSTMGLINVGQGEGAQIIQLFGRGVRLQGRRFSLMRSSEYMKHPRQGEGEIRVPEHIQELETLDIFGVRADYMSHFKEHLEREGLDRGRGPQVLTLPVVTRLGAAKLKKLKTLRTKPGKRFQRDGGTCRLNGDLPAGLFRPPIELDLRAKVQVAESTAHDVDEEDDTWATTPWLQPYHLAFLDYERMHAALREFCRDRGWFNFYFLRSELRVLLTPAPDGTGNPWYRLYAPEAELAVRSMGQVRRWQEIATTLLKKYMERVYRYRQSEYERQHMEYQELSESDPNFIDHYALQVHASRHNLIEALERIGAEIRSGQLKGAALRRRLDQFQASPLANHSAPQHLYTPLLFSNTSDVKIRPVSLENEGEWRFVEALRTYCGREDSGLDGKEVYLLRNQSRGRGIGFFEAGNFYPDFILWVLDGQRQRIAFIDPKGIQRMRPDDPKVQFHRTIKGLEEQLADPSITLDSFILSRTRMDEADLLHAGAGKQEYAALHIFFQTHNTHIGDMFAKLLA